MLITKKRIGVYSSHFQWRQHRWTQTTKEKFSGHGSETSNRLDPKFWKWANQRLDATLGTRPTRSIVTRRSGTSQIDHSFLGN